MTSDGPTGLAERPLRIWQVCESYPPKYGGGAGVLAQDISGLLIARGHEVRVLTTEANPDGSDYSIRTEHRGKLRIDHVSLKYLVERDPDGWQLGVRKWLRHEKRVARMLDEQIMRWRPDLVQYHTTRPFGEEGPQAIARHDIPVVAFLHEAWFICPRLMLLRSPQSDPCAGPGRVKCLECMYSHYDGSHSRAVAKLSWRIPRLGVYPAYRIWRRRAARRALSGAVAVSRFMISVHQPHLTAEARYLPLGINLEGLQGNPPQRPRKPMRFGFLAGFQPSKGIWDVLDAAAELKREELDFELHIWGPADHGATEAVAARGLADRTRLRGMYQPSEMWKVYSEIDVAVMATTVSEPFGRIPVEARAAGAPTIAPAIGGIRESIRHGVDGLLFRFRDRHDLQMQMRRLLAERGLYERLSKQLAPVIDTRSRGAALESVYMSIVQAQREVAA